MVGIANMFGVGKDVDGPLLWDGFVGVVFGTDIGKFPGVAGTVDISAVA